MGRLIAAIFVGILLVAAALIMLRGDTAADRTVLLYYYNPTKDMDAEGNILCSENGLVAVERTAIPHTKTPLQDAIEMLLRGELTSAERDAGITTEFPLEGLRFVDMSNESDGVYELRFEDLNGKTVGGSCRVSILRAQIEATAKQFDGVQTVRIMPEELFQP